MSRRVSTLASSVISIAVAIFVAGVGVRPAAADGATPVKLLPADLTNVAGAGSAVAIDGDTAVVGAPGANGGDGLVYVFVRDNGIWTQQATLSPIGAAGGFGGSIAMNGDVVLVGAPSATVVFAAIPVDLRQCGAVYTFTRTGATWTREGLFFPFDCAAGDRFGTSVAFDGTTALVGAPQHGGNGAAYLFGRHPGLWAPGQTLTAGDGAPGDSFGSSVAIRGLTALVGATEAQVASHVAQGAAYVFTTTNAGVWSQETKLIADDGAAQHEFGTAVTLGDDGGLAVIGAPAAGAASPGQAYVFTRGGAGWTQQQKLKADDGETGEAFGLTVALFGDVAAIGAPLRPDKAGAAYLFQRGDTVWTQRTKMKAPDGVANDEFGRAVAVDVQTVVVGAIFNGGHGAAYVFGSGPPTLSPIGNLVTVENEPLPIDFTIADPETAADALILSATSSNAALFASSALTISGTGAHRTLTMSPAPDQNGDAILTLTVSDGFAIATDTFHVRVLPINSPPTVAPIADQITTEDTPVVVPVTLGDTDTPLAQLFLLTMSSNTTVVPAANVLIGGSGASRTLTVTPALHQIGTTTITLFVSDGAALTLKQFTLTVQDRPAATYYLAEGATGAFFDTDLLLANPTDEAAPVTITFLREDGTTVEQDRTLAPLSRTTIRVDDIAGLEATSFSTQVVSTRGLPLVLERTMWWDASGYGAHGEKAVDGAAPQWYFAEGSQGFFSTFFLLVNPHDAPNHAHVTYFREGASELTRDYALPPRSRVTIDAGADPELINRSFGALVVFDQPGAAERAMYFGRDPLWTGGTDSAGVTAPSPTWFLAEGATGSFFATFVLIADPATEAATVTVRFLRTSGSPIVKTFTVPPARRFNVAVTGAGSDVPELADEAFGAVIESTQPIAVERALYSNANGVIWAAGTNATATPLP